MILLKPMPRERIRAVAYNRLKPRYLKTLNAFGIVFSFSFNTK